MTSNPDFKGITQLFSETIQHKRISLHKFISLKLLIVIYISTRT